MILDLDNTLVHAINCFVNKRLHTADPDVRELHDQFNGPFKMMIKVRPFLVDFFKRLNPLYKFFFYTMGNRKYAEFVC